jgi:hypothetical protein
LLSNYITRVSYIPLISLSQIPRIANTPPRIR